MKQFIAAALFAAIVIPTQGLSNNNTPDIDKRQKNQQQRIAQGIASGELTKRESKQLIQGQKQLHRMETRAKSDGVVTKKERARLNKKAYKESLKIKHNKTDKE